MAYIGKAPNTAIVNQATSQSFSGNGSTTAFTLTRSVNVGEDLEVFVNNVQQEPGSGKSYTASGTTLTFDEAPPLGTNNVYVIYRGEATINPRLEHDANAALAATTGTFTQLNSDNIRIDGNTISSTDTNGDITLDPNGTGDTIIASGNLGVGEVSPAELVHIKGASGAATDVQIQGGDDTNSVRLFMGGSTNRLNGRIVYSTASDFMAFSTGGDQRIRVDSDGLKFGSDTAAANALDDYEEGFWTPAFGTSGTGFSSIGYHVQKARYVKVGRQVHTWFLIATNALTKGSASSSVVITGLPYTVENVDYQSGVIAYSQTWVTNHPISCLGSPNQTQLFLYHTNGSTSHVNTSVSNMVDHSGSNKHYVYGALSYRAA